MSNQPADPSKTPDPDDETEEQRLTRNFNELLQELRVTQTGTQILTGFLLTLPFASRFAELTSTQEKAYLAIFAGSVLSTGLIVAPVALHRMLFRQGERRFIVAAAHQLARAGLVLLALTTTGVVWLIFDFVASSVPAYLAMGASLLFFVTLWGALPLLVRAEE